MSASNILFEGDIKKWEKFRKQLTELIENPEHSNEEKLQVLKSCLRGEPLKIINVEQVTYEVAWKLLVSHYTNHRLLVAEILDKLLDLPNCTGDTVSLQKLHDTAIECVQEMNACMDVTIWDQFVNRILVNKFDSETKRAFDQQYINSNKIPQVDEMLIFLKKRIDKPLLPAKAIAGLCNFCNGNHMIAECIKFLKLAPVERKDVIRAKSLCDRCLGNSAIEHNGFLYNVCTCKPPNCSICLGTHHTALHEKLLPTAKVVANGFTRYVKIDPKVMKSCIKESAMMAYTFRKHPLQRMTSSSLFQMTATLAISSHDKKWSFTAELVVVPDWPIGTYHSKIPSICDDDIKKNLANPDIYSDYYDIILGKDYIDVLNITPIEEGTLEGGYVMQNSNLGILVSGGCEYYLDK